MSSTEMFAMIAFALVVFAAVLTPLIYATVLDGRYNDEQQRRAARASSSPVQLVTRDAQLASPAAAA